jgi:hypothetical protein
MEHLEKLLRDVISVTQRIEASRKMYAAQIAPDFNAFNYIQTNELMLSRILADLLDPSKSHAQGDLFLKGFLKLLVCDWSSSIDLSNSFNQKIQVNTEVQTKASSEDGTPRRMDIYLTIKNDHHDIGLCVENKPFASDQNNQMADYYKELEKRGHGLFHLVYLKYDGSDPSGDSVHKDKLESWLADEKITVLSYGDLVPWLESCLGYIQNTRVQNFVKEFIGYIQKRFLGVRDMNERHEVIKLVTQSSDSIAAAFLVQNNMNDLKLKLMKLLASQLNDACVKRNWSMTCKDFKMLHKKRYFGFFVGIDGEAQYGFGFEFFGLNTGDCRTGLRRKSVPVDSKNDDRFFELRHFLTQQPSWASNSESLWWPAWTSFKYKNWDTNSAPWIAIQNGEMVQLIIAEAEILFDTLKKHDKLHLLRAD